MNQIRLSGELICRDSGQAKVVQEKLTRHVELTRNEPGCISFDVSPTPDPLIWHVEELFQDRRAFESHQARVRVSDWGLATTEIERRYVVTEVLA